MRRGFNRTSRYLNDLMREAFPRVPTMLRGGSKKRHVFNLSK